MASQRPLNTMKRESVLQIPGQPTTASAGTFSKADLGRDVLVCFAGTNCPHKGKITAIDEGTRRCHVTSYHPNPQLTITEAFMLEDLKLPLALPKQGEMAARAGEPHAFKMDEVVLARNATAKQYLPAVIIRPPPMNMKKAQLYTLKDCLTGKELQLAEHHLLPMHEDSPMELDNAQNPVYPGPTQVHSLKADGGQEETQIEESERVRLTPVFKQAAALGNIPKSTLFEAKSLEWRDIRWSSFFDARCLNLGPLPMIYQSKSGERPGVLDIVGALSSQELAFWREGTTFEAEKVNRILLKNIQTICIATPKGSDFVWLKFITIKSTKHEFGTLRTALPTLLAIVKFYLRRELRIRDGLDPKTVSKFKLTVTPSPEGAPEQERNASDHPQDTETCYSCGLPFLPEELDDGKCVECYYCYDCLAVLQPEEREDGICGDCAAIDAAIDAGLDVSTPTPLNEETEHHRRRVSELDPVDRELLAMTGDLECEAYIRNQEAYNQNQQVETNYETPRTMDSEDDSEMTDIDPEELNAPNTPAFDASSLGLGDKWAEGWAAEHLKELQRILRESGRSEGGVLEENESLTAYEQL